MSVDVVMPQMGESITEGTVSKWLKKEGDRIEKDEAILEISTDKVDAGVRWIELLQATVPQGKSPPTLTDFIELSIGGTLSVGGIGGQAFRWGLQVDNVLELEVITGRGELGALRDSGSQLWHLVRRARRRTWSRNRECERKCIGPVFSGILFLCTRQQVYEC